MITLLVNEKYLLNVLPKCNHRKTKGNICAKIFQFSSVTHSCPLFVTSLTAVSQTSLSITNSQSTLKLMSIESVMPSTISSSVFPFSSCPQSFPSSGSFPICWAFALSGQSIKSISFSISPSNEYSGLTSFRIDWFDFLAVQGTLKSLL